MPLNGSGTYTPPAPEFPAIANTLIKSADFNAIINDIAAALSQAIFRDGQVAFVADQSVGGFKLRDLAQGVLGTDAVTLAQMQSYVGLNSVYLGGKAADPTVRNDGSALEAGDLYFNTATLQLKTWDGATWLVWPYTDANLVSFLQVGTGATARTVQDKLRESVSVKDFGAVGDGVTDDTAAVQAAIAYINTTTSSGISGITYGSAKDLFFPSGKYKVSSSIDLPTYSEVRGENAAIIPTSTSFDVFTAGAFDLRVKGLSFIGGRRAIYINTGGIDTCTVNIEDCDFYNQTISSVETSGTSSSTLINIIRPKVYNTQSGAVIFKIVTGDKVNVSDGWATVAAVLLQIGDATHKASGSMSGMVCVPQGGSTVWCVNYGSLELSGNTRFGGEAAATIVDNYAVIDASDLSELIVEGCQTYCAGAYAVRFFQIPNVFVYRNNRGLTSSLGFYFDAGITGLTSFRSYLANWTVEGNAREDVYYQGLTEGMARAITLNAEVVTQKAQFVSQKVAQAASNTATGGGLANVSVANTTGVFGQPIRQYVGTSASYNGSVNETWNNQLTGLTSGTYTAVYEVKVVNASVTTGDFYGAELDTSVTLTQGSHLVCVPFYWNSGTSTNRVGWNFPTLTSSQTVELGNVRVFSGTIDIADVNNILYGTAAPTTLLWGVGDRVVNTTPTVGQPKSWVCTAAGTPGTWVSEGNL